MLGILGEKDHVPDENTRDSMAGTSCVVPDWSLFSCVGLMAVLDLAVSVCTRVGALCDARILLSPTPLPEMS